MPSLTTPATEGDPPIPPARHQTGLITIVFTDLVGSTALKQQVGDRTAASLIQQHHGLVRELFRGFQGSEEIETAGDSFLIVFPKPSDAVHFGLRLHARLRALNQGLAAKLEDRIGIHVGEVVIREQDGSPNPKGLTGIQVDNGLATPFSRSDEAGSGVGVEDVDTGDRRMESFGGLETGVLRGWCVC